MNMPKKIVITLCIILSAVIHYVSIESIPPIPKKITPITLDLMEPKKETPPPPEAEQKLNPQAKEKSEEDKQEEEKEKAQKEANAKKAETKRIMEAVKNKSLTPEQAKMLVDDLNNPMHGKETFKGFNAEEGGLIKEQCAEKNTYSGVGIAFDYEMINQNGRIAQKLKTQRVDLVTYVKVASVKSGGPAAKAGVLPGDYVDSRIVEILKKPKGSSITIGVLSKGMQKMVNFRSEVICFH